MATKGDLSDRKKAKRIDKCFYTYKGVVIRRTIRDPKRPWQIGYNPANPTFKTIYDATVWIDQGGRLPIPPKD